MDAAAYEALMQAQIAHAVEQQEAFGLDVLGHGEPERNDMVEYFGEQLAGFAFTATVTPTPPAVAGRTRRRVGR